MKYGSLFRYRVDLQTRYSRPEKEFDLLEIDGFEYEYASARLLARDSAKMLSCETQENILIILPISRHPIT